MSENVTAVRTYMTSYADGDHEAVEALLADDVVWIVHGHARFDGRVAYLEEMRRGEVVGLPAITADRYVAQGDLVAVTGTVHAPLPDGSTVRLVFADTFAFRDGLIVGVESYVVPEPAPL